MRTNQPTANHNTEPLTAANHNTEPLTAANHITEPLTVQTINRRTMSADNSQHPQTPRK